MICPKCESDQLGILDSRYRAYRSEASYKVRRRVCKDCDHRFTTYEVMVIDSLQTTIVIGPHSNIKIKTAKSHFDKTAIEILDYIKKEYGIE